MAGMKIRCTIIRNLTSSEAKGTVYGILLLLLVFAVPRLDFAQEKTINTKLPQQQSNPVAAQKSIAAASLSKEAIGSNAPAIPQQALLRTLRLHPKRAN